MRHPRPPRKGIHVRLPAELLEALDETADELVVSRNLIIERALERFLLDLELPIRRGRP
jgi:metal-responsive CopG/Arc/MetJ family transcriptional regulator